MSQRDILATWETIKSSFNKMIKELPEEELTLQLGAMSIGGMIRHNAEVEYMMTEWYLDQKMPENLDIKTGRGTTFDASQFTNLQALIEFSDAADQFVMDAIKALPEDQWHVVKESNFGAITPLAAVSKLLYHTGIHAGQISLIRSQSQKQQ